MKGKLHGSSAARIVYRSLWPVADLTLIGVAPSGVSCNKWTQHGKVLGRVEGNWIEICLILNVPRILASFEWGRGPPIAPVMILTQRLRMQENNLTMSEAKPGHCSKSQRNHGCIWLSFVKQRLTQIRPQISKLPAFVIPIPAIHGGDRIGGLGPGGGWKCGDQETGEALNRVRCRCPACGCLGSGLGRDAQRFDINEVLERCETSPKQKKAIMGTYHNEPPGGLRTSLKSWGILMGYDAILWDTPPINYNACYHPIYLHLI